MSRAVCMVVWEVTTKVAPCIRVLMLARDGSSRSELRACDAPSPHRLPCRVLDALISSRLPRSARLGTRDLCHANGACGFVKRRYERRAMRAAKFYRVAFRACLERDLNSHSAYSVRDEMMVLKWRDMHRASYMLGKPTIVGLSGGTRKTGTDNNDETGARLSCFQACPVVIPTPSGGRLDNE